MCSELVRMCSDVVRKCLAGRSLEGTATTTLDELAGLYGSGARIWLAHSVERETLNLRVVGTRPTLGVRAALFQQMDLREPWLPCS